MDQVKILNSSNEQVLPVTHFNSVRDSQGNTLTSVLGAVADSVNEERAYVPADYSGMGRVVLKKNMVSGVNTLTQAMLSATNTVYVIKYDYMLGADITVPANSVLCFEGGSIAASGNNDTITGNNTGIQAGLVKIFNTNVILAGTWNVVCAYPQWFGITPNDNTKDASSFLEMMCSLSINTYWSKGDWYFSPTCIYNCHFFKIIGESGSNSYLTRFHLLPNITEANYILKLGGKPDFGQVDVYSNYYVSNFVIEGIYFFAPDTTTQIVNSVVGNSEYRYAALVLDCCVNGKVNVGFNTFCPALYITASWEIIFEKLWIYYGGVGNANYKVPKIIIGNENVVTGGGISSSVNACVFSNIFAERINGPLLEVEETGTLSHCIFNNVFLEEPLYEADEIVSSVSFADYVGQIDTKIVSKDYVLISVFSTIKSTNNNSFVINNITLDWLNSNLGVTADSKYVISPILGYNKKTSVIINSIDCVHASALVAFYCNNSDYTNGYNKVTIGTINRKSGYSTIYTKFVSTLVIADDYTKQINIDFLDKAVLMNTTFSTPAYFECLQLNKMYDGYELERVLKNENNQYYGTNLFPGGIINGIWTSNRLLYRQVKADSFSFKIPMTSNSVNLTIICYCANELSPSNITLMAVQNDGTWIYTFSDITINKFGANGFIVEVIVRLTIDGSYLKFGGSTLPSELFIESIEAELIPSSNP